MTEPRISIRHDADRQHFVAIVDGVESGAVLRYRPLDDDTLEFYSTFTPTELRGQGLAGRVVRAALDYAGANGLRVVPTCPYVAKLIEQEPQYQSLVA